MRRPHQSTFERLLEWAQPPHFSERFSLIVQRSEYAMKRAGYLTRPTDAMASWRQLGAAVDRANGGRMLAVVRADRTCRTLFDNPPSKLIVHDGMLAWQEQREPTTAAELMDVVRHIRNSLVHGEKSAESPRDEELVRAAMRVLEIVIDAASRRRDDDPALALFVDALFESTSNLPVVPLQPPVRRRT